MERIFAGISQQDLFSDIELMPIRPDSGNIIELGRGGEATHGRFSDDVTDLCKNIYAHIFQN